MGKTLKFVYELEIKRRKEAEAREREEHEENAKTKEELGAGKNPHEELDFEQHLDVFRSQRAEGDYREAQAQHLPRAEREKQEKWAREQLKLNAGTAPQIPEWRRVEGGYLSLGKLGVSHVPTLVTDELLAEGRGGFFQRNHVL